MKKLLVVGAGYEQAPLIARAKERGFHVIAVDFNPNAYGFRFADETYLISTTDSKSILKLAIEKEIDGITYSITETPMRSIREVCDHLSFPGPSWTSVYSTMNKYTMREIFQKHNIPNPKYIKVASLEDGLEQIKINNLTYPLVIKPVDRGGQVGLFKINNEQELVINFNKTLEVSKEVIIEEYIDGEEVNMVALVLNGEIASWVVSDRIRHDHLSFGVVLRHLYPSKYLEGNQDAFYSLLQNIATAMEVKNGIIFPQAIVHNGEIKLIEVGERIPGGVMQELFENATGLDLLDLQIDISLGKNIDLNQYKKYEPHNAVTVKFLTADPGPLKAGRVVSYTGLEEVREYPGVVKAGFYQDPSREIIIRSLRTGADRFFYIVGVGDSVEEVINISNEAEKLIHFEVE